MNDPLAKTVDKIREAAKSGGLQIFYGWLPEDEDRLTVHWNQDNGGDWKSFLDCAKAVSANILYLNWAPFEQFQIDDAVTEIESEVDEGSDETGVLGKLRAFNTKVGLTCVIDLAFVANGVVHIHQETPDWFTEFEDLLPEQSEDEPERKLPDKTTVNKWAATLASHPQYMNSRDREYLLEKLAGAEFPTLPVFEVLRRAATVFEMDFKQGAEEKLAEEVRQLREQGLNLNAIARKLGLSRDRASGLASMIPNKK